MTTQGNPAMPYEAKIKCDYIHCFAGTGVAGSGCCFLFGMWWHPACPHFQDEEEVLRQYEVDADRDYEKITKLLNNCLEHQKNNGVDPDLWGRCEKCPAAETCPNFLNKAKDNE